MRAIEKLEKQVDDLGINLEHQRRLIAALSPDPSVWEHKGEVIDMDGDDAECACGHPIRWAFVIERGQDKKIVGSTCINHFASINPTAFTSLCATEVALSQRLAEEIKCSKEAQRKAEVEKTKAEFEIAKAAVIEKYESYRNRGEKAPYDLWCAVASNRYQISGPPEYKRTSDYIRWYKKNTEYLKQLISEKIQSEIQL